MNRFAAAVLACVLAAPALAEAPPKRVTAWPLLYHFSDEQQAETDILWPLLRYERKGSYTRYAYRPFIFSTESDPARDYRETSVIWPLSIYRHKDHDDWFHIFPVYWQGATDKTAWLHVWPLFGVYHRGETWTEYSTLWPLFRYGSDSKNEDVAWSAPWPLVSYEREGDRVSHRVLPLYSYEETPGKSSGFVLPYFWRTAPDHDTTVVLPFYLHDTVPGRELTFITPLYMDRLTADSRLRTLIPLYWDYRSPAFGIRVALPVYGRYATATASYSTFLPVYFHSRDDVQDAEFTYYFPLYGTYRRGEAVSSHYLLFPLYSRLEDRERQLTALDVAWPLFHYETSPDTRDVRALPFYWRSETPERSWTSAMLLYGSVEATASQRRWLVPFYFRKDDPGSSLTLGSLALLPPYYLDRERGDVTDFHIWPFYGHDRDGNYDERSFFWPLFRFGANDDGSYRRTQVLFYYRSQHDQASSSGVLPLWYHRSSPDETLDGTLFLHWYDAERDQDRTRWALLWLFPPRISLVHYEGAPGVRRHALFPVYSYSSDEKQDRLEWSLLWPLFSYESEGAVAHESDFLWKVITYERKDAQTRDFRFLWRFVRSSEAPGSSIFEFNPFYYREHDDTKGDYWNVLGGIVGRRTGTDGKTEMQWLWFF